MNFKQFLKPDWRKIVIFVLIVIFSFIINYTENYLENNAVHCEFVLPVGADSCQIIDYPKPITFFVALSYLILWSPSETIFLTFYETLIGNLMRQNLIVFSIPSLIFWYLLSCLITWYYDKYFKKVKKK